MRVSEAIIQIESFKSSFFCAFPAYSQSGSENKALVGEIVYLYCVEAYVHTEYLLFESFEPSEVFSGVKNSAHRHKLRTGTVTPITP